VQQRQVFAQRRAYSSARYLTPCLKLGWRWSDVKQGVLRWMMLESRAKNEVRNVGK